MNAQRNRPIILWLAALALLWGMLAPSFASGLAPSQGKAWIDVCTSLGSRLVALDLDGATADQAIHPGMHCAACVSQYALAVIAHPPGSLVLQEAPIERVRRLDGSVLPPVAANRRAHRSRAPPLAA